MIKVIFSQTLFTCMILALYFSVRTFRKWELKHHENRLFSGLCFASAIWSLGFWGVIIQTDVTYAYWCRTVGMIGVFAYLILVQILVLYLAEMPAKYARYLEAFSFLGIILYFFSTQKENVSFQTSRIGMTYFFNHSLWNNLYILYSVIMAANMLWTILYMLLHARLKRSRLLAKLFLLAEFFVVAGMLLDTILPMLGMDAIPGSTIGQFIGLVVMYQSLTFVNRSRITIGNMSEFIYYSLSTPVLVYDEFRKLQILNDAATDFLEVGQEHIPQVSVDRLFAVEESEVFCFEDRQKDIDTQCRYNQTYCNLAISKIWDRFHDLIGYIIIVTDLSERMRSIERLEAAINEATYANRAKTTFLANMSHEIRTPMNAIIGFSELILKMDIDKDVRAHVEDIRLSSQNLLAIINDILDITKIESGKMELVLDNYYLLNLLDDVSLIISQQAKNKGLAFQMQIDPQVPAELYGDKVRIRGILINILNNAVKYTKEGSVSLELSILERTEGSVKLAFKVTDTGVGIHEEDLGKLFKSFEQLDKTVHYGVEGSGLGLAIANSYVSLMGGEIQVSSRYGEGSVFTVILEQKVIDSAFMRQEFKFNSNPQEDAVRDKILIRDTEVLVVDDNYVNLRVAQGLLSSYGLSVDMATSGKEAIELCRSKQYALIFMDQMMPEVDGTMAMQQIRGLNPFYAAGGGSRIIVLTADAIRGVRERLLAQGFDEYLSKPMNMTQLERLLLRYLPEEKIVHISSKEAAGAEDTELAYLKSSMPQVAVEEGIARCGNTVKEYLRILKITQQYGEKYLAELKEMWEKKDYGNYTIKIHSMKSTSRSLGANAIADLALLQEKAGKEGNYSYIDANWQVFQKEYRRLLEEIEQVLAHYEEEPSRTEEEQPVLTEDMLGIIFANIRRRIDDFDFQAVFAILEEAEQYRMASGHKQLFEEIKRLMEELEVEEVCRLMEEYQTKDSG